VPQIGPLEILVVVVVALIVFGPDKLPDLARKVGRTATELRRIANEAKAELQTDFSLDDDDPPPPRRRRPRSQDGNGETAEHARPEESNATEPPASASTGAEERATAEVDAAETDEGDSHASPREG
jgi:sec-independent protein translocase protein TatB